MKIVFVTLLTSVILGVNAQVLTSTRSINNEVGGCHYGGNLYQAGQSWNAADGCNTCYCSAHAGGALCTEMACITTKPVINPQPLATCSYNNVHYVPGDTFMAVDGCNTCTCSSSGAVGCTEMFCQRATCNYNSKVYNVGDMFDDKDGCNTCHCVSQNQVACTLMYCLPILQNLGP